MDFVKAHDSFGFVGGFDVNLVEAVFSSWFYLTVLRWLYKSDAK